jgi:hypothetical protein
MHMDIDADLEARFGEFVGEVYDSADGSLSRPVDARQVARSMGINPRHTQAIILRLQEQRLLRIVSMANGIVRLTEYGVRAAEAGGSRSGEAAEDTGPVAPSRPRSDGSLAVMDERAIRKTEAFVQYLKETLNHLRLDGRIELGEDGRSEIAAEISTIENQVASPRPKSQIVALSLRSIKEAVEGRAEPEAASMLENTIDYHLKNLT